MRNQIVLIFQNFYLYNKPLQVQSTQAKMSYPSIIFLTKTIAFSDRPERLVKQFDTQSFVDSWNKNVSDSFTLDPPNAVIISDEIRRTKELSSLS